MGARPEDYAISAPYKSYIHVDDFDSPKELADYLHKLDQDDDLYNEYFMWKVRVKIKKSALSRPRGHRSFSPRSHSFINDLGLEG